MVIVSGRLRSRKYTDKNGNKRTQTEIVADDFDFADSKPDGATMTAPATAPVQYPAAAQTQAAPAYTNTTPYTPPQTPGYAPEAPSFPKYDDDPDLPF